MYLDLLTTNGLIMKSRYYDFNDTTCIVKISVKWFNMIYHKLFKGKLNLNTLRHTIYMYLDLLTSNGLIIKSCYYDFNDSIPIVNISVQK